MDVNMNRLFKYLAAVLVAAILGYLAYHYRQELQRLLEQIKDKGLALKGRIGTCREEQDDFADL